MTRRRLPLAVFGVIVLAVLCRLPALLGEPLDFQVTRQFRGAIITRGFETRLHPPRDHALAESGRGSADDLGLLEPPVMDVTTGALWAAVGERLWIPRALALLGYLAGGVALWLLGDRVSGRACAWTALALYSFGAYVLEAATAIQPDPWVVGAMCFSALATIRWLDDPTPATRRVAIAAAAVTIFFKPVAAPIVLGGLLAARAEARRDLRIWRDADNWRLVVIATAPGVLFIAVGAAIGKISPAQSFIASLLWTRSFWTDWLAQIGIVVTLPLLAVALVGYLFLARSTTRALGLGWVAGYVVFGLTVDYRVSTHDYYSLPLVPVVALGVGIAVAALVGKVPSYSRLVGVSLVALLAIGVAAFWRDEASVQRDAKPVVAEYKMIGDSIGHRPAVVLAGDGGFSFAFYARVRFLTWPSAADLQLERLERAPRLSVGTRLAQLRSDVPSDVFVVTAIGEVEAQGDLKSFLDGLPVLYRSDDTVVYQLPPRG